MNLIRIFFCLLITLESYALTLEEERKYDELEGLAFMSALAKDKKFLEIINHFPKISKKKEELGFYYFHLAEAHFALKDYKQADAALMSGDGFKKPALYYALWGRTALKQNRFRGCVNKYQKIPIASVPTEDWENYFTCLNKSGLNQEAIRLSLLSPLNAEHFLLGQSTLLKAELWAMADQKRSVQLQRCQDVSFYLRLWAILEENKILDSSVIEVAHACHPKVPEITSTFIKYLFSQGQFHSIAFLFERLNADEKGYVKHVAEFYKVAGRHSVADYYSGLADEADYLLARSAYFLNKENFAGLLSLPLKLDFLRKNKDLSYAMAYSQFKYLNLEASRQSMGLMPARSGRDEQLEKLLDRCHELSWQCRP